MWTLISTQREVRNVVEKNCLREYLDHHKQTLGRSVDVEGTLVRAQKEMNQCYWKLGGKGILVIEWQKARLNCSQHSSGKQNLSVKEPGYLAEEILLQS